MVGPEHRGGSHAARLTRGGDGAHATISHLWGQIQEAINGAANEHDSDEALDALAAVAERMGFQVDGFPIGARQQQSSRPGWLASTPAPEHTDQARRAAVIAEAIEYLSDEAWQAALARSHNTGALWSSSVEYAASVVRRLAAAPEGRELGRLDPDALEEAALAIMQLDIAASVPRREEAEVAVEAYLRRLRQKGRLTARVEGRGTLDWELHAAPLIEQAFYEGVQMGRRAPDRLADQLWPESPAHAESLHRETAYHHPSDPEPGESSSVRDLASQIIARADDPVVHDLAKRILRAEPGEGEPPVHYGCDFCIPGERPADVRTDTLRICDGCASDLANTPASDGGEAELNETYRCNCLSTPCRCGGARKSVDYCRYCGGRLDSQKPIVLLDGGAAHPNCYWSRSAIDEDADVETALHEGLVRIETLARWLRNLPDAEDLESAGELLDEMDGPIADKLSQIANDLQKNAVELEPEVKRVLYRNLPDLYETTDADEGAEDVRERVARMLHVWDCEDDQERDHGDPSELWPYAAQQHYRDRADRIDALYRRRLERAERERDLTAEFAARKMNEWAQAVDDHRRRAEAAEGAINRALAILENEDKPLRLQHAYRVLQDATPHDSALVDSQAEDVPICVICHCILLGEYERGQDGRGPMCEVCATAYREGWDNAVELARRRLREKGAES